MIIMLPKQFIYKKRGTNGYAYVNRGKLYIKGYVNFEELMYQLTYELYGDDECQYCGKSMFRKNRTIDHKYPRNWGGISIVNNLLPCCKQCNQDKRDMTYEQFEQWENQPTFSVAESFYKKCVKENSATIKKGRFVLPRKWVTQYNVSELIKYVSFKKLDKKKISKMEEYYEKHHQYEAPIIVSGNDWLFNGKYVLEHAKRHNKKTVPAIILDNVIVIKDSP